MDTRYVPPHKKGRYHYSRRQPTSVLPSKFLLGGNIHDPLNLNSLGRSDNANTPKTSPMPVPTHRIGEIPIFIPKNPTDPLGLQNSPFSPATQTTSAEVSRGVVNIAAKSRRHRRRSLRIKNDSECSAGTGEEIDDKCHADDVEGGNSSTCGQDKKLVRERSLSPGGLSPNRCKEILNEATPEHEENEDAKLVDKDIEQQPSTEELVNKEESVESNQKCSPDTPEKRADKVESPVFMGLRRPTSDYVPLSSAHQPSPFILRGDGLDDSSEMITFPFESPSLSRLFNSHHMMSEPFSPPTTDMYLNSRRFPAGHYDYHVQQSLIFQSNPGTSSARKPKYFNEFQRNQRPYYRKRIRHNRFDPIVSPVIPQPGMKRTRHHHHHNQQNSSQNQSTSVKTDTTAEALEKSGRGGGKEQQPQSSGSGESSSSAVQQGQKSFHPKNKTFQYGNYNRYYGYRNSNTLSDGDDVRLRMIKKEWVEGKDVLDIGCNVGHVTLSVARDFKPRRILGVDIDNHLVTAARKNIKHYIDQDPCDVTVRFPQYLPLVYGALKPCPPQTQPNSEQKETKCVPFPYNVNFLQENYVLDVDSQLDSVTPEFDAILCLSVTKWIHLNFGDDGLKRFFRRGFRHLRPGGRFILEPQNWSSYQKKKKLTEEIFCTFKKIQFFPDQFQEFLLKEVGYEHVEAVGTPMHQAKGFQRPLLVFTKSICCKEESS